MAKKSNSSFTKYLTPISLILGVVAVCMIFLTAIKYTIGDLVTEYTGIQVAFGYKSTTDAVITTITTNFLEFSIMNTLTYVLALAGSVLALLNVFGKKSKLLTLISAVCFIASAVLFFMVIQSAVLSTIADTTFTRLDKQNMSIGIGSIIGGVLAGLAGACQALAFLFNK